MTAVRRSKTQTEMLAAMGKHGESWFFSDGTSYGLRSLRAARGLEEEGLARIDHESGSTIYRVLPANAALSEQQS